jgi:signal peptide peptidase SppA
MSNPHTYDHLVSFALTSPWAVERDMLAVIASILGRRIAGDDAGVDVLALAPVKREPPSKAGGVAVIPMHGVIAPRMNLFSQMSGGTTFEQATADLRDAVNAKDVGTIVLDWDSPGGNVQGATEFAHEMLKARAVKPVISQVHHKMASAAYWTGACATEVVSTPSGVVGALGVFSIHNDLSGALEKLGVKRSYLAVGKYKVDGNETEPLSEETRARWLGDLERPYATFVKDVGIGRGVNPSVVRAGFGEGRAVQADEALTLGMIDRIGTLDDTIARAMTPTASFPSVAASQTPPEVDGAGTDREWRSDIERQLLGLALGR